MQHRSNRRTIAPWLALLAALALTLAACGTNEAVESAEGDGSAEGGESFTWDFMMILGVNHPFAVRAQEFADEVSDATDGRLSITVRPGGELPYGADEFVSRTGDGSVAMSEAPSTFIAGECSIAGLAALPFLVADIDELQEVDEALEPYLNDCFNERGARLFAWNYFPNQQFWGSGEPPESIDDLAGLRIRQTGAEYAELIRRLDAEPTTLTTAEVPTAVQRGTVNALITAALTVSGDGWEEFLDWGYLIDMGLPPSYILINEEAYEELPTDLRDVLDEKAAELQARAYSENEDINDEALDELEAAGLEIVDASEEEKQAGIELIAGFWEAWADGDERLEEALAEVRGILGK